MKLPDDSDVVSGMRVNWNNSFDPELKILSGQNDSWIYSSSSWTGHSVKRCLHRKLNEPTKDRENFFPLFLAHPIRGGGISGSSVMLTRSRSYRRYSPQLKSRTTSKRKLRMIKSFLSSNCNPGAFFSSCLRPSRTAQQSAHGCFPSKVLEIAVETLPSLV